MASPRLRVPHFSRPLREVGILTLETLDAWGAVQVQMSGKNFISVLLLLVCFVAHALAADIWIVRDDGVGPVKIGMTLAQLSAALHQKLSQEESGTEGCFYATARGHDHIPFMIIDWRVRVAC